MPNLYANTLKISVYSCYQCLDQMTEVGYVMANG